VNIADVVDMLADANPAMHRPGDAGKVYQLDKAELKELFPAGIAGAWHLLLFGSRSRMPQHLRRADDWWNLCLKDTPGMVIRKEASHIMSALSCVARTNTLKGEPRVDTPGFLIDGAPGTGKSAVLNHVAHWAMKTGEWIVVWVPHASDLVTGKGLYAREHLDEETKRGEIIVQPSYAIRLLSDLVKMNKAKLSELTIDEEGAKVFIRDAIAEFEELHLQQREAKATPLLEKVIAALKEQTKYPVLVAVDEINALHGMSLYRDLDFKLLPSQNVKMAKLLGAYLDAGYKRGVVVGAATRQGLFANVKLPPFKAKPIQLRGFTTGEIETYITYMHKVRDFFTPPSKELVEYLAFCTAGRPLDIEKACAHEIFNLGQRTFPNYVKKTQFYKQGGYDDDLITDPSIPDLM